MIHHAKMKTLLITGANRGIGLEFCRQYAQAGWRVLACCRHPSKALELPGVEIHQLDVGDAEQIRKLTAHLSGESIDLLINNAGIYPDSGGFGKLDYSKWMKAFEINAMAPLRMAEAFCRQMKRNGTIATLTSKMGSLADNTSGGEYPYRSSKAAANMVVKSMAIDLKSSGIISVALHPGWVKTDMGGPNALILVEESVSGMRRVIEKLEPSDSGKFLSYDGMEIPW